MLYVITNRMFDKKIVAFLKTIPDGNARNYQNMGKTSAV